MACFHQYDHLVWWLSWVKGEIKGIKMGERKKGK